MDAEEIEKTFFKLTLKNKVTPCREDMEECMGASGNEILEALGEFCRGLDIAWSLNGNARVYLAKKIKESPVELHVIASKLSLLPVWASESRVVAQKNEK